MLSAVGIRDADSREEHVRLETASPEPLDTVPGHIAAAIAGVRVHSSPQVSVAGNSFADADDLNQLLLLRVDVVLVDD